ncbi:MAG: transcriptional regulator [Cenarchaeum symbiont of Oopsacas minuta]|nr:transcriptional regulator [Cenarchaeum symbiont of Oopsacas minuta]
MILFYIITIIIDMLTILDKQIHIKHVITINPKQAKAIENPTRYKIVQIIYMKPMRAEQIGTALKRAGFKKALTTIRHHIEVLKTAGLIEVIRIEEIRGTIAKYYGTSTKLLGYKASEDFDKKYASMIKMTSKKIEEIFTPVIQKTRELSIKNEIAYEQFIQVEIFNRALAHTLEKMDISKLPKKKGSS